MRSVLVGEDVDVVIAAADGAQLGARLAAQPFTCVPRQRIPRVAAKQRVVHRRIVGAVLAADAERHDVLDFVGEGRQPLEQARRLAAA